MTETTYTEGEGYHRLWISAAKESLNLCMKCAGLAKQTSSMKQFLSASGFQIRMDIESLRTSASWGCPFCLAVSERLQYDLENAPELRILRRRSRRIFCRNIATRHSRSYKTSKFVYIRMRVPWDEYSDSDEPLMEDFEEIEIYYRVPKQLRLPTAPQGLTQWKRLLAFDVCAIPGDAMSELISIRPLTEDVGSEESFRQVGEWIKECCNDHRACPKPGNILPTRVVDVGELESNQAPKLLLSNGFRAPYTALSYCWGEPPPAPQPPQPVMTTTKSIDDFTRGLPVALIPQTIKDAIHTTRQLGFRYLWVDVLCILQDDRVDKRREIRKMKEIFSNAVVTISAACSNSCHTGFLYQRDLYRDNFYHRVYNTKPPYVSVEYPPFLLPIRCPDGRLGSVILHRWMTTRAAPEPINSRAWTLEERLLSPRVLAYSSIQLLWECQEGLKMLGPNIFELIHQPRLKQVIFEYNQRQFTSSQGLNTTLNATAAATTNKPRDASKVDELRQSWMEILIDYTVRKMTLPEDRLLAISGVAAVFAKGFDTSAYRAGIWFSHEEQNLFLLDLMWYTNDRKPVENTQASQPSWSWAAVEGGVSWHRDGSHAYARSRNSTICRVLECSVVLESVDSPFGNVKSGILKIEGPLKEFRTMCSERSSQAMRLDSQAVKFNITQVVDSHGAVLPSFPAFLDTATLLAGSNEDEIEFSTVWALLLLKNMGLLLLPAAEGTYRRVGMFFWNDDGDWFDDTDLQKLSIVTVI